MGATMKSTTRTTTWTKAMNKPVIVTVSTGERGAPLLRLRGTTATFAVGTRVLVTRECRDGKAVVTLRELLPNGGGLHPPPFVSITSA
jgi:hypothetical protein